MTRRRYFSVVAAIGLLITGEVASMEVPCEAALRAELGKIFDPGEPILDASRLSDRIKHPASAGDIRYLRLLLERNGGASGLWRVAIRDTSHRVLQWLGPEELPKGEPIWTQRFAMNELRLTLHGIAPSGADDLRVIVNSYFVMPKGVESPFYSAQVPDDPRWEMLHQGAVEPFWKELGDSVGILITRGAEGAASCSGVAVGLNLFLTNWHCGPVAEAKVDLPNLYWDQVEVCDRLLIDFSWDADSESNDFRCVRTIAMSRQLDYALIKIKPVSGQPSVPPLRVHTPRLQVGDEILLIHHPQADVKQRSTNCNLGSELERKSWDGTPEPTEFTHLCDTEGGSSGAPILDTEGRVRGLHHLGFDRDFDGDAGTCSAPQDNVNKAVWIDAIVEDLETYGVQLGPDGFLVQN